MPAGGVRFLWITLNVFKARAFKSTGRRRQISTVTDDLVPKKTTDELTLIRILPQYSASRLWLYSRGLIPILPIRRPQGITSLQR